ncbi:NAD-dependent epimerase/dehydratase family protein [Candidatus Woesearchaeota archaeon]|nr:NAD-dependent epimerase/dehydratase family protein [Candidatus Woesearchaeota archaeon]
MKGKVIVTGGAGFIGSHIVDALIDNEYDVVVVDNLVTGSKDNLNAKARFYQVDITHERMAKVFEKEKPDFVVHHAAQINVRQSLAQPVYDAIQNIIGTIEILELCRDYKVKKMIYAGSGGACYGEPQYLPCDEKHPANPVSHYGVSKYSAEHYLFLYKHLYDMDYIVLRYSNVYGPRQDPKGEAGVISIFLDKIKNNERPHIFGDGNQTRDYVFVKDVARANLLALENQTQSRAFNIGTGKETSVNQLFEMIKQSTGTDLSAAHIAAVPGEVRRISLKCDLAKQELGWGPEIGIEDGIRMTSEWFIKKQDND